MATKLMFESWTDEPAAKSDFSPWTVEGGEKTLAAEIKKNAMLWRVPLSHKPKLQFIHGKPNRLNRPFVALDAIPAKWTPPGCLERDTAGEHLVFLTVAAPVGFRWTNPIVHNCAVLGCRQSNGTETIRPVAHLILQQYSSDASCIVAARMPERNEKTEQYAALFVNGAGHAKAMLEATKFKHIQNRDVISNLFLKGLVSHNPK